MNILKKNESGVIVRFTNREYEAFVQLLQLRNSSRVPVNVNLKKEYATMGGK